MSLTKADFDEMYQRCLEGKPADAPAVCPLTGRRFFDVVHHPDLEDVPVYGGPFDSYTIPVKDEDGNYEQEHYDWDYGGWRDPEAVDIEDDEPTPTGVQ